jgi:hypothetical protein
MERARYNAAQQNGDRAMKRRIEWLANLSDNALYSAKRSPGTLDVKTVCPHCKRPVFRHAFRASDGYIVESYSCPIHQGVIPIKSHVSNEY